MTEKEKDLSLTPYLEAVLARKARQPVVLDVRGLTSIADAFIVCSGRSNRQVMAIAEHIQVELKKQGIRPLSVEGSKEGHWTILDYGDVVIHVFFESVREFYDLEGLWIDARRIPIPTDLRVAAESGSAETEE
jgi:ribosome-associated protein